MLIGTSAREGAYITVAVEVDEAERPWIVLEEQQRPGSCAESGRIERSSLAEALRDTEKWLLARGGALGAEAEGLACSPVGRELGAAMFGQHLERFVHLPARPLAGG